MKKIVFLVAVVGLAFHAMGQKQHKAIGDKPVSSKSYSFFDANDSTLSCLTHYTYDGNQRIVKEISDYSSWQDSTITAYDAKGRVTSIRQFSDGELLISQAWNYDDVNSKIEHSVYSSGGMSEKTILYGVKDMDATDNEILLPLVGTMLRDCDSMHMSIHEENTSLWIPIGKVYPVSQGGNVTRVRFIVDISFAAAMFEDMLPIDLLPFTELEMNIVFTYQSGKIQTMKISTSIDMGFPIPIPMNDFVTVTFQYYGDLLIQVVTAAEISILGQDVVYMGQKEVYFYNQEGNILCTETYSTAEKDFWVLDSKTWYSYDGGVGIASCTEGQDIAMGQNIPNPASNSTCIEYRVANAMSVQIGRAHV